MSEYHSSDRNIAIRFEALSPRPPKDQCNDTADASPTDTYHWAQVSVLHPFLARLHHDAASEAYTLSSKVTNAPVVSLKRPDGQAIALAKEMPRCLAELVQDNARPVIGERADDKELSPVFGICVPSQADVGRTRKDTSPRRSTATPAAGGALVPEIQQILDTAIQKRRLQMETEAAAFLRRQQEALETFVAQATEEAETLSEIASLAGLKQSALSKSDDGKTEMAAQRTAINKKKERLSGKGDKTPTMRMRSIDSDETATASDRSVTSQQKQHQQTRGAIRRKRPPHRSETAPLPKSVLVKEVRRKASLSHLSDGSSRCSNDVTSPITPKRVMFSEQEPQRIDSPVLSSDVEDDVDGGRLTMQDETEVDEVFDMDETIPVVPVPLRETQARDSPGMAETASDGRLYGRQADHGLSGSFKMRSMDKYAGAAEEEDESGGVPSLMTPDARLKQAASSSGVHQNDLPSMFATSLPRNMPVQPTKSPLFLSSVKDLKGISPPSHASPGSPLDDSPPTGISRELAWRKAVQSSLRMSGLVLPMQAAEDVERAVQQTLSKQGTIA